MKTEEVDSVETKKDAAAEAEEVGAGETEEVITVEVSLATVAVKLWMELT
jgi:hypothetical protein